VDIEHCLICGDEITDTRFALARARTGDLVFCGGQCWQRWEAGAVTRMERLRMEEMFLQVAADAIQRCHPQAPWIVAHSRGLPIPLTDAALEAAVERLGVWLADQAEVPVDPDSYLARHEG
jgi:hypothetical protein